MKNKTYGECRFYFNQADFCRKNAWECIEEDKEYCEDFEPPTNGDVIRNGSNRELAEYFVYETGAMLASTLIVDKTFNTYEEAIEATEEYLNAPAESEVEDEEKTI